MKLCAVTGLPPAECLCCPPEPEPVAPAEPAVEPPTEGPEWTRPDTWPDHPLEDAQGRFVHLPPVYTIRADRHCPPGLKAKLLGRSGWFPLPAPYFIPARCSRCHRVLADGDPVKWTSGEGSVDLETHGWCCDGTKRVAKGGRPPVRRSSFFR